MIEWTLLASAFISLFMLAYLHVAFIRSPITCLKSIDEDWPKEGVLRIEIISDPSNHESYLKQMESSADDLDPDHPGSGIMSPVVVVDPVIGGGSLDDEAALNSSIASLIKINHPNVLDNGYPAPLRDKISHLEMFTRSGAGYIFTDSYGCPTNYFFLLLLILVWPNDNYIVEYSLEYGFLRLSAKTRQRLKIPVKVVVLDPAKDACFGDQFSRFLLRSFLGYDDILMGSLKSLAEKQNNKGFVRNVVTGEHYRFVNIWYANVVLHLLRHLHQMHPFLSNVLRLLFSLSPNYRRPTTNKCHQDDQVSLHRCPLHHAGLHPEHFHAAPILSSPGLCFRWYVQQQYST